MYSVVNRNGEIAASGLSEAKANAWIKKQAKETRRFAGFWHVEKEKTVTTAKKKPTAAQLAARKLFAARAKAGTLGKKRKTTAKAKPARKAAPRKSPAGHSVRVPPGYCVFHGSKKLATFGSVDNAKLFAQEYADRHDVTLSIEKK